MTDREMLELAAKAAGWSSWDWLAGDGVLNVYDSQGRHSTFDPLTDDGDEARLEAALGLNVEWQTQHVIVGKTMLNRWQESYVLHDGDKQAARRYAGVRAAAAIGQHKDQPIGINSLTEAETSVSASVMGLTRKDQG